MTRRVTYREVISFTLWLCVSPPCKSSILTRFQGSMVRTCEAVRDCIHHITTITIQTHSKTQFINFIILHENCEQNRKYESVNVTVFVCL